jgi:hypothetical protein
MSNIENIFLWVLLTMVNLIVILIVIEVWKLLLILTTLYLIIYFFLNKNISYEKAS